MSANVVIAQAKTDADIAQARQLFRDYATALGVDLGFQGFEEELVALPGAYVPPKGALLLARIPEESGNQPDEAINAIGAICLRPLSAEICEMKRLYVRPEARGLKLGLRLVQEAFDRARAVGYSAMRLDTLAQMKEAQALYERLGFVEIAPYYDNPLPGTRYFELDLTAG